MSCCDASEILEKSSFEKKQFSMDFSAEMTEGETISGTPDVTSTFVGGGTSDLTISDVTTSGQTVLFWIEHGTARKSYHVTVQLQTSASQKLEGRGTLKITY